jgi:hypothetical protein
MYVLLTNSIHNKKISIKVLEKNKDLIDKKLQISRTTYHKIKKQICGDKLCKCNLTEGSINKLTGNYKDNNFVIWINGDLINEKV